MSLLQALEAQTADLTALLDELAPEDWERPTRCPPMRVREMVGHLASMWHRVIETAANEIDEPPTGDRVGYYRYDVDVVSKAVLHRAEKTVRGRSDPELRAWHDEQLKLALDAFRSTPPDRVVRRAMHPPMPLREFVATRVLEAAVHTMDIGHATLRGERVHDKAVPVVTGVLDGLLGEPLPPALGWDPKTYILTGTGRRPLSPNERVTLGPLAVRFPLLQ